MSVESGQKRMTDQKKGPSKTRLDELSSPVKVSRARPARATAEGTNNVDSVREKPGQTRSHRRSSRDETSALEGQTSAAIEESKRVRHSDQEDNRSSGATQMSAKERSASPKIKKDRYSGRSQDLSAKEGSDPIESKKEIRSKKEKVVSFSKFDSEPINATKERRSETRLKDESVKPEGVKPKKSKKEGRSKLKEKDEVLKDESALAEERSEPTKPKKERSSRTNKTLNPDGESVSVSEDDSKKKKKKKKRSKKKAEDVLPTNKDSVNGLSAMVEPWTLLKKVVENHREEVHVLKGIMDLRAAKTGDRAMLHQLETLLKEIDKDRS
ncbi:hypothetical protein MPTK1_4g10270 [Marchantia polymorpha subsp. ruderalis]|nr:hypothetical protein MARPO_0011s0014 [Marchantia polymorpha]BBN08279.1 hypothetical protein Mp_4g10270 [Marchantia polymorpha subsp. ruderalis]|eukprot:PTQ46315.1 hypothetical protein MARPO_0011s0014 [Marchantia polymorpha]